MQYTDTTNEETVARSTKEGSYSHADSRRGAVARNSSTSVENQQERINRANRQKSGVFKFGATSPGGIARQLITKVQKQLAYHKAQTDELEVTLDELHQFIDTLDIEKFEELEQNE